MNFRHALLLGHTKDGHAVFAIGVGLWVCFIHHQRPAANDL
jgi:hypothetical protein